MVIHTLRAVVSDGLTGAVELAVEECPINHATLQEEHKAGHEHEIPHIHGLGRAEVKLWKARQ